MKTILKPFVRPGDIAIYNNERHVIVRFEGPNGNPVLRRESDDVVFTASWRYLASKKAVYRREGETND